MNYPYYPQYTQQTSGFNWVQGEAGAKSYLVAPNNTVMLMDSEGSKFYLKSADNAGMPTLRVFEYKELTQATPKAPNLTEKDLSGEFVTREEYEALKANIEAIAARLDEQPKKASVIRKAASDDGQ